MTTMKITHYPYFPGDETDFDEVKCLGKVLCAAVNIQDCGNKVHELKPKVRIL